MAAQRLEDIGIHRSDPDLVESLDIRAMARRRGGSTAVDYSESSKIERISSFDSSDKMMIQSSRLSLARLALALSFRTVVVVAVVVVVGAVGAVAESRKEKLKFLLDFNLSR